MRSNSGAVTATKTASGATIRSECVIIWRASSMMRSGARALSVTNDMPTPMLTRYSV